jgi:hypothetical protein
MHCEELILPDEVLVDVPAARLHRECLVRSLVGSISHLEGKCSCFVPGAIEGDPPGLTRRAAAKLVLTFVRSHQHDIQPQEAS